MQQYSSGAFAAHEQFSDAEHLDAYTTLFTLGLIMSHTGSGGRTLFTRYAYRVLSHWQADGKVAMMVQGDDTLTIHRTVQDLLSSARKDLVAANPFAVPVIVLEHLMQDFDDSTWTCLQAIRKLEQQPWYRREEKLGRIDVDQILDGIADTPSILSKCKELAATANYLLDGVAKEHEIFLEDHAARLQLRSQHKSVVSTALRSQQVLMKCFHSRSEALLARMNHLTNMVGGSADT